MSKIRELLRWGRVHGGAIGLMGLDDGRDLVEPLGDFRSLEFIHVFDRWRVHVATYYAGPAEANYGKPEIYKVTPQLVSGAKMQQSVFDIHESRILRCDGEDVTTYIRNTNQGWGDSVYQACFERLRSLGAIYAGVELIVEDFYQAIIKVDGLTQLIAAGKSQLILERLNILDMSKHIGNVQILDENEDYSKHSTTVSGLPDIMDRFVLGLSAATSIPVTLLMGQAPAGLNSTGDSDIRNWYDAIASEQEERLTPIVQRMVDLVLQGSKGPGSKLKPKDKDDINHGKVKWVPLWQLTESEEATRRKTVAETDAIYINTGVLDPTEVAESRFGGDTYSADTTVDLTSRDLMAPDDRATKENETRIKEKESEIEFARKALEVSGARPGEA